MSGLGTQQVGAVATIGIVLRIVTLGANVAMGKALAARYVLSHFIKEGV
ncbi:MAG: hypothetical protein ACERKN_18155 [Velocimicrobium sp.]